MWEFFVDSGYRYANRGAHFEQGFGEIFDEGTVGESDAVVEHGEIHVARCDVGEGKKRNAQQSGAHVEAEQGAMDVGGHVAVRQHRALGGSGGAGGVDDGGEVVGLDGAGQGFGLGIEGGWALGQKLIHSHASRGQISGDFDVIHDYDFLDLRLGEDCLDLAQLMFGGNEN